MPSTRLSGELSLFVVGVALLLLLPASSVAQYFDPNEPNNSFGQATSFSIPDTFKVDLDPVADTDYYRFAALKGDTLDVFIRWAPDGPSGGLTVDFYDSDTVTILRHADVGSTYHSRLQYVFQHDGDYFLKVFDVHGRGGPTFDYELRAQHRVSGEYYDPLEPNDVFAKAAVFSIPDTFKVDLDPAADADYYRFTAVTGDTLDVFVRWAPDGPSGGLTVDFYDSDMATILRHADVGSSYYSRLQYVFQHDGNYFLKVFDVHGRGGPTFDYELRVQHRVSGEYYDPFEPNDTFAEATVFSIRDTFNVDVDPAADADYYSFAALIGDTLDVFIQWAPDSPAGGLTVDFYDSDTVTILRHADVGSSYHTQLQYIIQHDGDYYLKVFDVHGRGGPGFDYFLRVGGTTHPVLTTITLQSPDGGESWDGGTQHYITWTTTGASIDHIRLLLSTDGGGTFPTLIVENTPDDGSFEWTVPSVNTTTARVKAQARGAAGQTLAEDVSSANFEITTGGVGPNVIWTYDASSEIKWFDRWEDGFATGDLNDDGKADVVIGTTAGEVVAIDGVTGIHLWRDTIPGGTEYVNADIIDVDGDGLLEVVAGGKVTSDSGLIIAYNKNGSVKWSALVGHPEVADFAYGDVDGDGHKDVAAAIGKYPNSGGAVALLDGRDGSLIWDANLGSGIAFGIDAKDIDSDGDMEVAVTNYDSKVFLIDGRSDSVLWSKSGVYYGRDVIIGDVNDSTGYEVVSVMGNVYCYNDTGKLDWVVSSGVGENLTMCNPNEDDTTDILIADPWNGKTTLAIGRSGRILWTRSEAGAADVGDLDGDGDVEIVVGSLKWYSPDFSTHHLRAVDSENNLLWEYDLDVEPTAVVVADIDADNKDEVLYTAGSELVALNVDILPVSVEPVELATVPNGYALMQNYPNPFNPTTTIRFALPHAGFVTLKVYSVIGEAIATLAEDEYAAGTYRAEWDASGYSSGVYIYRLIAGNYSETRKMVLIR
jgi:hypothetical protein